MSMDGPARGESHTAARRPHENVCETKYTKGLELRSTVLASLLQKNEADEYCVSLLADEVLAFAKPPSAWWGLGLRQGLVSAATADAGSSITGILG